MKIFVMCMECAKELGHPSFEPIIADYYEASVAYIECNRGHKSVFLLQSQKFEILLESAANALIAGYTLEAASSFYAAYERFIEFFVRVICKKNDVEATEFVATFNQMTHQSERQLGAFLCLYLLEFGKTYKLNTDIPPFRNKIIHKGHIPTPDEVESFAEKIYQEIFALTQKIKPQYGEYIDQVVMESLNERNRQIPEGTPRATSSGTMFFSLGQTEQKPTFTEALTSYKEIHAVISGAIPAMKLLNKAVGMYNKLKNNL